MLSAQARLRLTLLVVCGVMLVSCGTFDVSITVDETDPTAPAARTPLATAITKPTASPSAEASPTADATATPAAPVTANLVLDPPPNITALESDLLVDGERGWLFARGREAERHHVLKLEAETGQPAAVYETDGLFALDRQRGLLLVDGGEQELWLIDIETDTLQQTVLIPKSGTAQAPPQSDPAMGRFFVFRDQTIFIVGADNGDVAAGPTLDLATSVCGERSEEKPAVIDSYYDLTSGQLHLAYVSYVCTPWLRHGLLTLNGDTLTVQGEHETEFRYQATSYLGSLYGTTVSRLGLTVAWAWNGQQVWYEANIGQATQLQGFVADWRRQVLFEVLNDEISMIDPLSRQIQESRVLPQALSESRLLGHDPQTDQLYFLSPDQAELQPVSVDSLFR